MRVRQSLALVLSADLRHVMRHAAALSAVLEVESNRLRDFGRVDEGQLATARYHADAAHSLLARGEDDCA